MKNRLLSIVLAAAVSVSFIQASWVVVNDDGSSEKLTSCCPKKIKRVVKEPEVCLTCDYSKFTEAKLLPVGKEKLQPATLANCGQ
jgi:hypothetical protein